MCQVRPTTVKLAWQWNVVTLSGDILRLHLWCAAIMHMPPWITPNWFDSLYVCGKYCIQIMDIALYLLAQRWLGFFLCCWMWLRRTWWRHPMETFSALLVICAGNSPVPGEFLAQRPVTRSFDVFFHLRLNKRLSKQSWGWWFETLFCQLWRHRFGLTNAC